MKVWVCLPMGKADRRTTAVFDNRTDALLWCASHEDSGIDGWDAKWFLAVEVELELHDAGHGK